MKTIFFITITLTSNVLFAEILHGTARDKSGQIVYLEKHDVEKDESGLNKSIRVEYSRPDGSVFATMTSDFSKNRMLPDTVFDDQRSQSKITLKVEDRSVLIEEHKKNEKISQKKFSVQDSMVASQGFDNFIRKNMDVLSSKSLNFLFGVLEKKDFYELTGYKIASNSSADLEFGIRASNWLFRLFADELKVVYDGKSKKLKSFAGRSNILNDAGEAQNVVISYEWKGKP